MQYTNHLSTVQPHAAGVEHGARRLMLHARAARLRNATLGERLAIARHNARGPFRRDDSTWRYERARAEGLGVAA